MKIISLIAPLALVPSVLSVTLSYDPAYSDPTRPLTSVACSDGPNGLITPSRTTLGSVPNFPFVGGTDAVAGWNSNKCGTCWKLTYTSSKGVSKSINVVAVDHASPGWNVATEAMNALTGNQAVQLGRINVTSVQVAASVCGL